MAKLPRRYAKLPDFILKKWEVNRRKCNHTFTFIAPSASCSVENLRSHSPLLDSGRQESCKRSSRKLSLTKWKVRYLRFATSFRDTNEHCFVCNKKIAHLIFSCRPTRCSMVNMCFSSIRALDHLIFDVIVMWCDSHLKLVVLKLFNIQC